MTDIITYSLKNEAENSDYYYNDVSCLTNNVILKAKEDLSELLDEYKSFIKFRKLEELRTEKEYLFDLLNAGTIWRIYYWEAYNLSYPEFFTLANLYKLRRRNKKLKPLIDWFRGIMGTYSLTKKKDAKKIDFISLNCFTKVIRWMEATGEFREEVKRMKFIRLFLKSIAGEKSKEFMQCIIQFSGWFEVEAGTILKQYTPNVEEYLNTNYKEHFWKEDVIFCGRKKVEYHLSMVGAELMNMAFRDNFHSTNRKAVLLPACMKLLPDEKCKAKKISLDFICSGCSPNCKINKYSAIGKENSYEVHIIPHSSDFTNWLKHFAVGNDIGVVGVACPLNLTTGGLELKSLNVPAQCILIDYCGCKTHWDKKGIPTDINFNELERIINGAAKEAVLN
jgi:hypothetical protein